MTSLLEQRYRMVLRLLPSAYRDRWADDMAATYMEVAYASDPDDPEAVEMARPAWGEIRAVVGLAVRLRLGGTEAPARPRLWGDAVRQFAVMGLVAFASVAIVGPIAALVARSGALDPVPFRETWQVAVQMLGLLWVPPLFLVLFGQFRAARGVAAAALVADAGVQVLIVVRDGLVSDLAWFLVGLGAVVVASLGLYQSSTPRLRPAPWLVSAAIMAAVSIATAFAGIVVIDWFGLCCVAVAGAGIALRNSPSWTLAVAMAAVAAFGLRVVAAVDLVQFVQLTSSHPLQVLTAWAAEAAAALATAVACGISARRTWLALPPVTYVDRNP